MRRNLVRHFTWLIGWLRDLDLVVLVALLVLAAGLWIFLAVADLVEGGRTQGWDERLLLAFRDPQNRSVPLGPKWFREVARDLTALGGVAVLFIITTAVVGYLAISQKYHAVLLVLAATLGGLGLSTLLKDAFDRPRPTVTSHLSYAVTSSFPSGHSMLAAVVYLTLGSLLARLVKPKRLKVYFLVVALFLTFLVGLSRVYMGVHYPTDVLAGWAAGLGWAVLCWLAARYLQRRGAVESAS